MLYKINRNLDIKTAKIIIILYSSHPPPPPPTSTPTPTHTHTQVHRRNVAGPGGGKGGGGGEGKRHNLKSLVVVLFVEVIDVGSNVLGCRADMLGTNCNFVEVSF